MQEQPPGTYHYAREKVRVGKVPLNTKIYQGLGALADTYKNFAFNTFLLFFYNQVLGIPAFYASIALMLALVVDAVSDPFVGAWSDGLKTNLGRRHPLMYASAIPLGLSLYFLFVPPAGLGETGLFIWLVALAIAVRLSMTLFQVPWNALFAEFSDDYAERSTIVTFRYLIGWIGGVTFVWCTWTFIFPSTPEYTPGHLNPDAYPVFAASAALLVTAAIFLTTWLTRDQIPYLLQPKDESDFSPKSALRDTILALRNRNFVILFICLLMTSALGGTISAFEIYLNTYFWDLAPEELRWFTLTIFGAMAAFIITPFLQQRYDKKNMLIVGLVFLLVNGIALILLRFADLLPDNGDPLLLYILIGNEIIRVGAVTIVAIMYVSMIADTLDQQELDTGRRQEGVFAAALSFAGKATSGLGIMISGAILDYGLTFPRGVTPEDLSAHTIFNLGLWAGVLIPLLYVIPFYLLNLYSLTREKHAEIQAGLSELRAVATPDAPAGPDVRSPSSS